MLELPLPPVCDPPAAPVRHEEPWSTGPWCGTWPWGELGCARFSRPSAQPKALVPAGSVLRELLLPACSLPSLPGKQDSRRRAAACSSRAVPDAPALAVLCWHTWGCGELDTPRLRVSGDPAPL